MEKRRWGDRKDGTRIRHKDSMHCIMPLIFPKRCESEVFMFERVDLTKTNEYLKNINAGLVENRYNLFHIIIAAILKTIYLRPHLNRFIANQTMYQRNELSAAFVVKMGLTDDSEEALAFIKAEAEDNLEKIRDKVIKEIEKCRDESQMNSSERAMGIIALLPGVIRRFIGAAVRYLDRRGLVPQSLIANDPHYATVLLTQLGSIKLNAGYHHLTDWGTNSLFLAVGTRKKRPYYDADGNVTMRSSIDLGITVDERISDGFYFAKSIRLMKKLLEHPELLEDALSEKVIY